MFQHIHRLRNASLQAKVLDDLHSAPGSIPQPHVGQGGLPGAAALNAGTGAPQPTLREKSVDFDASAEVAKADRLRQDAHAPMPAGSRRDPVASTPSENPFDGMVLSEQTATLLSQYRRSRVDFGMARMRLGSFLHLIRENKLWEGLAENWEAFVAMENINPHAARQYINVAKTFIFDMDLSEEVLGRLSVAGISALEKAARVITLENREEVIAVLANLAEADAIQRIIELSSSAEEPKGDKPPLRVLRLLKDFYEMPPDMQQDFLGKVSSKRKRFDEPSSQGESSGVPASRRNPGPGR